MPSTYAHLELFTTTDVRSTDRAAQMPLLGLLSGLVCALTLWTGIAALLWAFLD